MAIVARLVAGTLALVVAVGSGGAAQPRSPVFSEDERQAVNQAALRLTAAELVDAVRRAEEGDLDAQVLVAQAYFLSRSPHRDPPKAIPFLERAAARGHPLAQYGLGASYRNMEGQTLLAFLYLSGSGVPRDVSEGNRWLRAAAEQGHPVAQFNLGIACRNGDGVPKSKTDAAAWLKRASDQGHAAATCYLGQMYWSGDLGRDSQTRGEGIDLFAKSATQGYALAALVLGDVYMAERNPRLACTWLATARELAKTPEWQEEWAVLRPFDDEEIRKRLPKLLAEARKKLTPQQLSECEDEAVRWLRQQGIVPR